MSNLLLVADQRGVRNSVKEILEYEGHSVASAASGITAIELANQSSYDTILFCLSSTEMDIYEFTSKCESTHLAPIVMITESGSSEKYARGKSDCIASVIERPFTPAKIISTLKRVSVSRGTARIKCSKKEPVEAKKRGQIYASEDSVIIGVSEGIRKLKMQIDKVAKCEARVLIIGANGTGKELVAKRLHNNSRRREHPFVELNCAAIPSDLIESEMFGHEKGAFTSAYAQRKGKFELASGGTLFMDEIGDMAHAAQAKVLRALQERRITRVGGDCDISINTRVIAATNKHLPHEIADGRFREDLYHRLGVVILHVPPLRDRKDDIPLLVDHFITSLSKEDGVKPKAITKSAMDLLMDQPWNGNVRELRNVVERLIIFSEGQIEVSDVDQYVLTDYYM